MHVYVSHLTALHAQAWAHISTTYTLVKFHTDDGRIQTVDIVLNCADSTCFFMGEWYRMNIERSSEFEDIVWIWR